MRRIERLSPKNTRYSWLFKNNRVSNFNPKGLNMNPYTAEYKQLEMRLNSVRADLKNCNLFSKDWYKLTAEEAAILKEIAKG